MKLLALALVGPALAVPAFSAWPHAPALTLAPFSLSGCRGAPLPSAPLPSAIRQPHAPLPPAPRAIRQPQPPTTPIPANKCTGFALAKSFRALAAAEPLGQTCVLTLYTGAGCDLAPRALHVGAAPGGTCFDTGLPLGWLGGGNEASWSVMWNCNLIGH